MKYDLHTYYRYVHTHTHLYIFVFEYLRWFKNQFSGKLDTGMNVSDLSSLIFISKDLDFNFIENKYAVCSFTLVKGWYLILDHFTCSLTSKTHPPPFCSVSSQALPCLSTQSVFVAHFLVLCVLPFRLKFRFCFLPGALPSMDSALSLGCSLKMLITVGMYLTYMSHIWTSCPWEQAGLGCPIHAHIFSTQHYAWSIENWAFI